jgi:serine/threonine protein kinase
VLDICDELEIMASLRFQHICQVLGGCVINGKEVWLVLEYVDGGNLREFITNSQFGSPSWELQLSFATQATKAVNYLHSAPSPIFHRDIKSYNFLVRSSSKQLLLTDFGLAKAKQRVNSNTATTGTLKWAAPEVLSIKPVWSEKADVYSLGMVLFEIISGQIPFQAETNIRQLLSNIEAGIRPNIPDTCPKVCPASKKKEKKKFPLKVGLQPTDHGHLGRVDI